MAAGEGRPRAKPGHARESWNFVRKFRPAVFRQRERPSLFRTKLRSTLDSIVETFTFRNRRMLGYFVDSIADFNSIQILIVLARNEIRRRGFVQNGIAWVAVNTRGGKNVAVSGTKTRCWLDVASPEGIARGGETRKQL